MSFKVALLLGLCLVAAFSLSSGEQARYDNYRVYKVVASNPTELAALKSLEGASDSMIFMDGVHIVGKDVNVVVAPHKVPDFLAIMGRHEVKYELMENNLQSLLDKDDAQVSVSASARAVPYDWTQYYELDDTYRWMQSLVSDFPGVVTLIEGGKSYERRSILGLKISHRTGRVEKPGIFLEAGIHAREWIAPATATYIINQLLTSTDPAIVQVAQSYDWYIFPHANPDGYVYTQTDRLWRKTRTPYGSCYGADPNRNWGFHWNEVGASDNPCSDTYAGPRAFSEVETLSLSEYIAKLGNKIHLYISFHAYSQYLLYPYGHTSDLPDNVADFRQVYTATVNSLNKRYGTTYTGGNIYDAIYPAAGASVDWAYGIVGTRMAFCYELRPSSNSILTGFRLPAAQIIPTGEETMDSVLAMIGEVDKLGYFKQ